MSIVDQLCTATASSSPGDGQKSWSRFRSFMARALSLPVFYMSPLSQSSEVLESRSTIDAVTVYSGHTTLNQALAVSGRYIYSAQTVYAAHNLPPSSDIPSSEPTLFSHPGHMIKGASRNLPKCYLTFKAAPQPALLLFLSSFPLPACSNSAIWVTGKVVICPMFRSLSYLCLPAVQRCNSVQPRTSQHYLWSRDRL
jgi:hypothetical protein